MIIEVGEDNNSSHDAINFTSLHDMIYKMFFFLHLITIAMVTFCCSLVSDHVGSHECLSCPA